MIAYILPLYPFSRHILARRRKQGTPAPLVDRIFQERSNGSHTHFPQGPVRIHGLFLLIRTHPTGMRGINPRPVEFGALKAWLVVLDAPHEGTNEEDEC